MDDACSHSDAGDGSGVYGLIGGLHRRCPEGGHLARPQHKSARQTSLVVECYSARYFAGGVEAIVEHGIARLPDNTACASSVTTLDVCVRNGIERLGLSLRDSVRMASSTPATIIGVADHKGGLEAGKDADRVIMDADANVRLIMARGEVVYQVDG